MAFDVPASNHDVSHSIDHASDDDPPLIGRYLFFRSSGRGAFGVPLPGSYTASLWSPSIYTPWPRKGILQTKLRFLFRSLLHFFGFFSGSDCGAVCVYFGRKLVHCSAFTPRYWHFGFMGTEDIQIGDTWTDTGHRGRGLAQFAIRRILCLKRRLGRYFWYCVEDKNLPSIHVAERAGFEVITEGSWQKPLGIKLLGSYVPRSKPEMVTGTQFGGHIRTATFLVANDVTTHHFGSLKR